VNKKNIIITIILLIIFSTASIFAVLAAKKITVTTTKAANSPDFFITNAIYTQFDHNGDISNQFYTNKITHFTSYNSYVFEKPSIKMHNANEQPWNITANKGKSERGKSTIYLWDNVKVTQAASPNNSDFDITTDALTVHPDIKFAETTEPIIIIQSESIATAIGAQTNFKEGTVKLLSNVKCQYETK